jgi:hypothetical protein
MGRANGPRETVASLLSALSKIEQRELLADLNYLNMGEIRGFCKKHSIPYAIWTLFGSTCQLLTPICCLS